MHRNAIQEPMLRCVEAIGQCCLCTREALVTGRVGVVEPVAGLKKLPVASVRAVHEPPLHPCEM